MNKIKEAIDTVDKLYKLRIRYNMHKNRLYIDMDWLNDVSAGDYLLIECHRKLDPSTYTDIFDDLYLKKYLIQLIKKQWGSGLCKTCDIPLERKTHN